MCLVCVAASSPEIVVVVGGYAATRVGRPLQRLRSAFGQKEAEATAITESPEPQPHPA